MEPLEQATVLMTLMRRLSQLMDQERNLLCPIRLESLIDVQDEKAALAEAYAIELDRLRRSPATVGALDSPVCERLHEDMRAFQESLAANLDTLIDAQMAVEEVLLNIMHSLTRSSRGSGRGADEESTGEERRGEVIPLASKRRH